VEGVAPEQPAIQTAGSGVTCGCKGGAQEPMEGSLPSGSYMAARKWLMSPVPCARVVDVASRDWMEMWPLAAGRAGGHGDAVAGET